MSYLLELLNRIDWDYWIFTFMDLNNYSFKSSDSYSCLFFAWDIEEESDDFELKELLKKGIITAEDADIIKVHRTEILIDVQLILNESEEFNRSKRESIKLIWKCLKKYGLSDNYIKYLIKDLYRIL